MRDRDALLGCRPESLGLGLPEPSVSRAGVGVRERGDPAPSRHRCRGRDAQDLPRGAAGRVVEELGEPALEQRGVAGGEVEFEGIIKDITRRKQNEEVISRRNRELSIINSIAVALNHTMDFNQILIREMILTQGGTTVPL